MVIGLIIGLRITADQQRPEQTGDHRCETIRTGENDNSREKMQNVRGDSSVVFESGQFSSLLSMVGAGMGVSIVPEMAIERKSQCRYVRIADDQAVRTIGTAILRGRSLTRAQAALLHHLSGDKNSVANKTR